MNPHPDVKKFEDLMPAIREMQELATEHGIDDIFQDNGAKTLWTLLRLGLKDIPGREGNDAVDDEGNEYEMKSLNIRLQNQFTTHHHLNPTILAKYRLVDWIFTLYCGIELVTIYRLTPDDLEPLFLRWENQYHERGSRDLNNPKIRADFVQTNGELLYQSPNMPGLLAESERARQLRRAAGPRSRRK